MVSKPNVDCTSCLLHISSRRSHYVRCSSQIRYTSLRCSSRRLYFVYMFFIVQFASCYGDIWHMRESLVAQIVTNMQPPIPFKCYLAIFSGQGHCCEEKLLCRHSEWLKLTSSMTNLFFEVAP